jgi:hypothetical protein
MIDTNKIDFTKPLQTCSGLKVRILSTAFELGNLNGYPVIAEVEGEGYITYTETGDTTMAAVLNMTSKTSQKKPLNKR